MGPHRKAVVRDALLCAGFAFALWLALRQGQTLAFILILAFAVMWILAETRERPSN